MTLRILGFPLRFLRLTDEKGRPLYWRDIPALIAVAMLLSLPFVLIGDTNYFGADGLLDRVADFSSTLTGFYIAGLVAVAAFGREISGLDKVIEVGPVLLPSREKDVAAERLTRREYVCLLFGYLAFISLVLTLLAISTLSLAGAFSKVSDFQLDLWRWQVSIGAMPLRSLVIFAFGTIISSLGITTLHGLYYLIDRLYAKSPEIVKKSAEGPRDRP